MKYIVNVKYKKGYPYKSQFFLVDGTVGKDKFLERIRETNEDLDLRTAQIIQELPDNGKTVQELHELTDIFAGEQ